jgi:L-asparaginase type II
MEETAYFLHLTVRDPRPVVLVGSMRNSSAVSADGPANLLSAVRTAVTPEARGKGVLVVLNDWIMSARDVRKMDSNRVDTFRSEWGPLGLVDADGVLFRRALTTRHTAASEFDLAGVEALPEVAVVADFAGHDGTGLAAWAETSEGIVLQAFANGRASPGATRAAGDLAERGFPVVIASRVPEGRVMSRGGSEDARPRPVTAGDLPPHKARVLLMLALTRTRDAREIQRLFDTH